jgi:hypothetical protein
LSDQETTDRLFHDAIRDVEIVRRVYNQLDGDGELGRRELAIRYPTTATISRHCGVTKF